ncbi:hypothetical protein PFISCL1PPCAC_23794, partial [Pristionchus fissidentatus]
DYSPIMHSQAETQRLMTPSNQPEESIDNPAKSIIGSVKPADEKSVHSNDKLIDGPVKTMDDSMDDDNSGLRLCIPFRFVIVLSGMLCLISLQANITVINLAFVCMSEDSSGLYLAGNGTLVNRFIYTPKQKGFIISAVAVGTFIGAVVYNWLHAKYGARWPFFSAGLISAASTIAIPFMAEQSVEMLVVVRFIQGFAFAADFAAAGVICVRWAPLKETGTFIGILMCFGAIAFTITNPIVGAFCTSRWGWRAAFYSFGTVTSLLFVLFSLIYRDDPQKHKAVSKKELAIIEEDKTAEHLHRDGFVPYKEICKDRTILVVWFNSMIEINTAVLLLTYAPIYFSKVLGYTITETSYYASLGAIFHSFLKMSVGYISDSMTCFSERAKLIFFNTIAAGVAALTCAGIGFAPSREMGVFMLTLTASIMAANAGGFFKCGALVARQYAHFVLATMQMMKCAAHIIGPTMVTLLTHSDGDAKGWRNVFILNCVLMLCANFLFYPFATGEPAPFTKITKESKRLEAEEKKRQREEKKMDTTEMA